MCYLDHVGATLYAESQIKAIAEDLCENVYGNPHSLSISSRYSTDVIDQIRYRVLQHFNTDLNDYSIIFTSGATHALKLVAESFDWTDNSTKNDKSVPNQINYTKKGTNRCGAENDSYSHGRHAGTFVYLQDNHTSVLGMREVAKKHGANVCCLSYEEAFQCFLDCGCSDFTSVFDGNSLFVYPAQCNYSGVKYPLSWVSKVQNGALNYKSTHSRQSKWFCLLDAASFVSTSVLDLSQVQPDFVCLSFYKIFGYPTGLGALLVKNSSSYVLEKCYFGGGTVLLSLSSQCEHIPRPALSDRFEDGTIPFLSIAALRHGFCSLKQLTGDMASVMLHTFSLARYLFQFLLTLHHSNGSPAAILYCDTTYEDASTQGNVVNFNMLRPNGAYVGFIEVLNVANLNGIQLRTGCFCNPGACQRHLKLSDDDLRSQFQAGHICGDDKDLVNGQPTGSVRVSFGYMTTKNDVDKLINVLTSYFVHGSPVRKLPAWWPAFQQAYKQKFQPARRKHDGLLNVDRMKSPAILHGVPDIKIQAPIKSQTNASSLETSSVSNYGQQNTMSDGNSIALTCIYVYPVKSCGAVRMESWYIGLRGLLYDREWMVVTPAGVCLTQKQDAKLCLIQPNVDLSSRSLILQFPEMPPISVPLDDPKNHNDGRVEASLCQSKVCGDRVQGWDCGDDVASWLCDALGRQGLRLIRQWNSDSRVSKEKMKSRGQDSNQKSVLSLSNQAQFLLVNKSSVQWLSDQIDWEQSDCDKESLLERFRSNLVIQGLKPFEENEWTHFQIGRVKFQSEGPCTRCQMVCIDQSTGVKTREPLRTLAAAFLGKMKFGVYLSRVAEGNVRISVGDEVIDHFTFN
ncbi:molybdenum cofactor sulfurase isoform X2 [Zootermopsis nevadensis]|nr:molybdenum cofactor sulfurase isoform X2 [Zootermopsis nevadensis]XP_021941384.1 molybdenum cofactor sulfurase isoform X2 [Zootermopsis nevadensis]